MGIETTGTIYKVFETKQVSERFTKRDFVIETTDNPRYPQLVMFQITGDKVGQLDGLVEGDEVRVEFSVRGREWRSPSGETKYFNTLDAWKVQRVDPTKTASAQSTPPSAPIAATPGGGEDDCPF